MLGRLEASLKKVALPWYFTSNTPFYVNVSRPRDSLSKHNGRTKTYWHCDDGEYLAICVNWMPEILQYIRSLEKQLEAKDK